MYSGRQEEEEMEESEWAPAPNEKDPIQIQERGGLGGREQEALTSRYPRLSGQAGPEQDKKNQRSYLALPLSRAEQSTREQRNGGRPDDLRRQRGGEDKTGRGRRVV